MFAIPFMLLLFVLREIQAECPEKTLSYRPSPSQRGFCYIVLKYQEIKFIRQELWGETTRPYCYGGYHDCRDSVDSYQDALRMCALIPEINVKKWEQWIKYFKEKWKTIPGDDIRITLPTPKTRDHLEWLVSHITVDEYTTSPNERNRGKLWLDIQKSSSNLSMEPNTKKDHLAKKPGECGYIYRSTDNTLTGLYWVQCTDNWIENPEDAEAAGSHNVACQFEEPADCEQEMLNETCIFSETRNSCVIAGFYKHPPLTKHHARLGKPCRANESDGFAQIQCPKRLASKACKKNCVKTPWVSLTRCLQELEDTGTYYVCIEEDGRGIQFEERKVKAQARYEGKECPKKLFRNRTCICGGQTLQMSELLLIWLIVIVGSIRMVECSAGLY